MATYALQLNGETLETFEADSPQDASTEGLARAEKHKDKVKGNESERWLVGTVGSDGSVDPWHQWGNIREGDNGPILR